MLQMKVMKVVDLLIKAGANPEQESTRGLTAIFFAVRGGHTTAVEKLLEHGVDINKPVITKHKKKFHVKSGTTPLMMAIQNAHYELALRLLDAGAKANELSSDLGILHVIARNRKPDRGGCSRYAITSWVRKGELTRLCRKVCSTIWR